jgi:hypothetical protein
MSQSQEQPIDRTTSASICNAIGERLRQHLVPAPGALPSHLQSLLDEMQRQDSDNASENTRA